LTMVYYQSVHRINACLGPMTSDGEALGLSVNA
jgi:hypothetical protein